MKNYFTLISNLADKQIHPSVNEATNQKVIIKKNETNCPSSYGIKKAVIFLSACFNSFSAYYKSPKLMKQTLESILAATKYVTKGSYEPVSFCISVIQASNIFRLAKTYAKILSSCDKHLGNEIQNAALDYMEKSKDVLMNINTDNLYLYSALCRLKKDLKDEIIASAADNIKQSVTNLSKLDNVSICVLCDIYRETKDKSYLKAAQNNMENVLKLLEPDDTVISIEDEKNNLKNRKYPLCIQDYLGPLLYLSSVSKNEQMDKALFYANKALVVDENPDIFESENLLFIPSLVLLNKGLLDIEISDITRAEALSSFSGYVSDFGIYRHGTGTQISQTIYKDQDLFYSIQSGALKLRLRLNATFFGPKGRFKSTNIEKTEKGIRLHYQRQWGYWLPLEDKSVPPIIGSDINKIDRKMIRLQDFDVEVYIELLKDGADITMTLSKTDEIPCKLDLIFDKFGVFDSDSASINTIGNDYIQLQNGYFSYSSGSDYITAGPAFNGSSIYSETLRGSNPPIDNTFTVYFTDMTPTTRTISIRGGKA